MVKTNMHANVNIISQRSEHTWQEHFLDIEARHKAYK